MIKEKALKLAEYDGWVKITNKDKYRKRFIKEKNTEFVLIKEYSSFDKLMELFVKVNNTDVYMIDIDCAFATFSIVNEASEIIFETYFAYTKPEQLQEALMDCLLKYYELTKGE